MIKRGFMGLVGLSLLVTAAPATAEMEDIVVSATRRDSNLQQVPLAVSAFEADNIEKLQIVTSQDIGDAVPNLQTYAITAGAQAMQIHARGASVQNPGFNVSESPVGIYEDDVYRGRLASANLDLTDVERIEVLRGPQATLYGRNTIAGAIKIVTRKPGDEFWANGSVGYGRFETAKVTGSVGGPIEDGALAGSVAFSYQDRGEGWQPNPITGREAGEFENKAVRGKLRWFGGDAIDATFTGWAVKQENDGYNGVPYTDAGSPVAGFYSNLDGDNVNSGLTDQSGVSLDLNWNLGSVDLRSITAYTVIDDEFDFDLAGGGFGGFPGVSGLLVKSVSDMDQVSQELHLIGKAFNENLDWLVGAFYLSEDGSQTYNGRIPAFFVNFTEASNSETISYAVFAEATYNFSDRLSATVGGRWTRDDKEYRIQCLDLPPNCIGNDLSGNTVILDVDFDEFTPKLGIQYSWSDNVMTYASVSSGFQAGGFQTLCFGNLNCAAVVYDPQTVWNYEVGVKGDLLDDTLRLNAAVFYAQYDDIQQTVPVQLGGLNPSFPLLNVGDVDVAGAELEATWSPADNLNIFGNVGYMDGDEVNPIQGGPARELPSNPEWSLRAGFDYSTPAFGDWDLLMGADINVVTEYFSEVTNALPIERYSRINGFFGIGQPDGRWSLILSGKNLTDSRDNVSGLLVPNTTNIRTPLPPREYMLTLNVKL